MKPIFLLLSVFLSCTQVKNYVANSPEKGIFDLSNLTFNKSTTYTLDGFWKFYWNSLLVSEKKEPIPKFDWVPVPNTWKDFSFQNNKLPGIGFATYSATVILPKNLKEISILVPSVETAFTIFWNGEKMDGMGLVSSSKNASLPAWRPLVVNLPVTRETNELQIEVSNFHHARGGISVSIKVGTPQAIQSLRDFTVGTDLFLVGAMLIMTIYHFGLYLLRKIEKAPLYFGLFCLMTSMRILLIGERYLLKLFPDIPFEIQAKLEYLAFTIATVLFSFFLNSLFPFEYRTRFTKIYSTIFSFFYAIILTTNLEFYSSIINFIYILMVLGILYGSTALILAVIRKREGALEVLAGFLVLIISVLNDIFYNLHFVNTGYFFPVGVFIFIFSQSYVLAFKFSKAFRNVEILSKDLDKLNSELETKVKQRTNELQKELDLNKKENVMARRIQRAIIPGRILETPDFKVVSSFHPLTEVGGDIFQIHSLEDGHIRIMLADATGHGVQAALVTMAIHSEYITLKEWNEKANIILKKMNMSFIRKYSAFSTFFTSVIVDLFPKHMEYSFAGHPEQFLLRNGEVQPFKNKGKLIGFSEKTEFLLDSIQLQPKDRIFLFTDGLFELVDSKKHKEEGEKILMEQILETDGIDLNLLPDMIIQRMKEKSKTFAFNDDVTLVCIEVKQ